MFSKMKIGDFSELNSISVQTLRYYEKLELIQPIAVDPLTHYRYYHLNQSAQVDIIQFLKQFDFSLLEIKQMLAESDDLSLMTQLVADKLTSLLAQRAEIELNIDKIKAFQAAMSSYDANKEKDKLEIKSFPKRYLYTFPISRNIYEMDETEYEYHLREFKQYLIKKGFSLGDFNRVGSLMKRTDFISGHFTSTELFIFLPRKITGNQAVKELRAGKYAVYYCQSFKEELAAMERFKEMLAAQDLHIMGDYICEVIYEIPKNNHLKRNMFIRIQVPID